MSRIVVPIVPRKMNFDFSRGNSHDWCNDNIIHTAYMNGVSLALPLGEDFFIRSIRQFESSVTDTVLRSELKRFVAQEAIHSKQHQLYNNQLVLAGYDIEKIQARTQQALDDAWDESTPIERMAFTIALEHLTHVLADQVLSHRNRLRGWNSEFRAFWLWHAAEEVEHKAVCFDLYRRLGGTYSMRSEALLKMSWRMLDIFRNSQYDLLLQACAMRGIAMPSSGTILRDNIEFMFGSRRGLLRGAEVSYLPWFMPSYHPWKHDNREALDSWRLGTLPLNHVADISVA